MDVDSKDFFNANKKKFQYLDFLNPRFVLAGKYNHNEQRKRIMDVKHRNFKQKTNQKEGNNGEIHQSNARKYS